MYIIGWNIDNSACKIVGLAIQSDKFRAESVDLSSMYCSYYICMLYSKSISYTHDLHSHTYTHISIDICR